MLYRLIRGLFAMQTILKTAYRCIGLADLAVKLSKLYFKTTPLLKWCCGCVFSLPGKQSIEDIGKRMCHTPLRSCVENNGVLTLKNGATFFGILPR